jgi:hippurate hydrolase
VLESLSALDLELHTGGATSAVVAVLRGARPGPTLLLRADMDALPLQEETTLPFRSERDGTMHACGHDAHVAMLAGAARLLAGRRAELPGTLKFLFQPGKELRQRGADRGGSSRASRASGHLRIHRLEPAAVAFGRALLAAGDASIDLSARAAAAQPHLARDPIPAPADRDG